MTFLISRVYVNLSDPEINDNCLTVCRVDYVTCRQNCDSTSCESACSVAFAGNLKIILKSFHSTFFQIAADLVLAAQIVRPAALIVQNTRFAKMNVKTRKSTTKNIKRVWTKLFLNSFVEKKNFKNSNFFLGYLFKNMPARNWMSQLLLRKLHSNAIFVSLYWTRGKKY